MLVDVRVGEFLRSIATCWQLRFCATAFNKSAVFRSFINRRVLSFGRTHHWYTLHLFADVSVLHRRSLLLVSVITLLIKVVKWGSIDLLISSLAQISFIWGVDLTISVRSYRLGLCRQHMILLRAWSIRLGSFWSFNLSLLTRSSSSALHNDLLSTDHSLDTVFLLSTLFLHLLGTHLMQNFRSDIDQASEDTCAST